MRPRLLGLLAGAALFPSSAAADPVVVIGPGGSASVRNDPYLTVPPNTPSPSRVPPSGAHLRLHRVRPPLIAVAANASHRRRRHKHRKTVSTELARLRRAGALSGSQYGYYRGVWNSAVRTERRLHGPRKLELGAVIENMQTFAAGGALIPSRLPALFLTVASNQQYWTTGPLLSYGQRVECTEPTRSRSRRSGTGAPTRSTSPRPTSPGTSTGSSARWC